MTTTVPSFSHPLANVVAGQIVTALDQINAGNEVLNADESGTKNTDIDKVLKNEEKHAELPKKIVSDWKKAQEAKKVYDAAVEAARNAYRTEVLGEEPKKGGDVDLENLKEVRKVAMDALTFLDSFASANGLADVTAWMKDLAVPQIGRKGTSTIGVKKPRVFVHHGDKVYGSFSEAAAAFSDKDNKVTASQIAEAWNTATGGKEKEEFKFGDNVVYVVLKTKDSDNK